MALLSLNSLHHGRNFKFLKVVFCHFRCGHCSKLVPEYKKAATALKGIARVGAVDATQFQSLAGQYGVRGYPSIKVFGLDKKKPTDYNGMFLGIKCFKLFL